MWFDVAAALSAVAGQGAAMEAAPAPAPPTRPGAKVAEVAKVAGVREQILVAIAAGNHRPGPIATATKLGATVAYQELDRMQAAGLVSVSRDGRIHLPGVNSTEHPKSIT